MNALLDYESDSSGDGKEKLDQDEGKQIKPASENNFFNLNKMVESDDDEPKTKHFKKQLTTSFGVTVEVPSEQFWESVSCDDIKFVKKERTEPRSVHNYDERARNVRVNKRAFEPYRSENYSERAISDSKLHVGNASPRHKYSPVVSTVSRVNYEQKGIPEYEQIEDKSSKCQINNRRLFYPHSKINVHLHRKPLSRIPRNSEINIKGHSGPVNRMKWNVAMYSHLLLSVAMDGRMKVWNIWSTLDPCVQSLNVHTKAVKDACWSHSGKETVSCGYDKVAILCDVDQGKQLTKFQHESYVNCVKCHPDNSNLFVSGSYNILQAWDRRTPDRPIREFVYKDNTGQVQDVIFSVDGKSLFCCCDILSRDSADRNIMAWDFSSGVVLSNQIYQERYSCTRLQLHPTQSHFLAQTNGDYIAIFSTNKPFKLNKAKRFQGHKGNGYVVGFDLSVDGSHVVSGSADGNVYFYNYNTGHVLQTLTTGLDVCTDVAVHPVLPSTVACCGWNGHIQVWS
ncbi:WD repeat-containing protein 25-like [Ylistrum balloti]|uniref:WD repeat-containing protein 25-like n=1 Tax=Ylistrum balloti TaxID=509963 RepID=UPI002905D556|nr:WD repeat-containing protein 25-like [Ylistrum balloti]